MQKMTVSRSKTFICLLSFVGLLVSRLPTGAHEIKVNGLPCNDLCQAWLEHNGHDDTTGSTIKESKLRVHQSTPISRPIASAASAKKRRPEKKIAKVERYPNAAESDVPKALKTVAAAKHVQRRNRQDQANVPLPVPQPLMPSGGLASAVVAPMAAAIKSPARPRKLNQAAALPDAGKSPPASINRALPPIPDRPAAPDTLKPQKERLQFIAPTAAIVPPLGAPLLPQSPNIASTAPRNDVTKPSPDMKAVPLTPIDAGDGGRPDDVATGASKQAAARTSTVVASPPSLANSEGRLRSDVHPSGDTQDGSIQPIPEPAEIPLPVTVGQISIEPRGTDVHVVVVNVLQREMKNVDVRCRARDAQGLQVAEASANIASIAPSDVAFGQVLFPAAITVQDNKFTCDVGRIAASDNVTP